MKTVQATDVILKGLLISALFGAATSQIATPPVPIPPLNDAVSTLLRLNCSTFVKYFTKVNLASTFLTRPMTFFAPTDAAFEDLDASSKEILAFNLNTLYFVILNHVIIDRRVLSFELKDNKEIGVGLSGRSLITARRTRRGRRLWIRGRSITITDVPVENGIIHVVDGIMFPPSEIPPTNFLDGYSSFSIIHSMLFETNFAFPKGGFTFFAPTNEAFERLPPFQFNMLTKDNMTRLEMLYNLVIPTKIYTGPIETRPGIYYTINRRILVMNAKSGDVALQQPSDRYGIYKDKINMVVKNIEIQSGLIHTIDGVIFPPPRYNLLQSMQLFGMSFFANAIRQEGLAPILLGISPLYTIFVPTNNAVKKLPSRIRRKMSNEPEYKRHLLLFHIYRGIRLMQNVDNHLVLTSELKDKALVVKHNKGKSINIMQATVTHRDIAASNGVINVIDEVLLPQTSSVADTLLSGSLPRLSIFAAAIQATGLLTKLNDTRYIVFAPTDEAFNQLPTGSLPYLMANHDVLRQILSYHVVPGFIYVEVLSNRWVYSFRTLLKGSRFRVHRKGNLPQNVHIMASNSTTVLAKGVALDYPCSNGIVNMIDRVVIPPGLLILPPQPTNVTPTAVSGGATPNFTVSTIS